MIDFHSHILPGVDDGSQSVSESLALLQALSDQGVKTVVATPHFYANHESVEDFLSRRAAAAAALKAALPENAPEILCGAEVRYYPGISRMTGLTELCIEGSRLLLLEMSMSRWTEYTVKELIELASYGDITLVMAHMERYMKFQEDKVIRRLYESGIRMQFNASFFSEFSTKRKAISMLRNGEVHLIGSDCHNLRSRPPRMGQACEVICKKLGQDFLTQFNAYGRSLLHAQSINALF